MRHTMLNTIAAALVLAVGTPVLAQDTGDWTLGAGTHVISPKSGNGRWVDGELDMDAGYDWRPTVTAEYFFNPHWGLEALASLPFDHNTKLKGLPAASAKFLPFDLTLQYHFDGEKVSPFLGAGLNYTMFFDQETTGPLAGTDLDLSNSWGLSAHAGLDFKLAENRAIRVDVRWIDIDTDVEVNGNDAGTVSIDPLAYGAAFIWTF